MTAEATLDEKATKFADTLTALTRGVLGEDSPPFSARNVGTRIQVAPIAEGGKVEKIPVRINGEKCLELHVQHLCCWDTAGRYLAADRGDVHVFFDGSAEPLMRYEYVRDWRNPPGAHLQIHAHRDELAYLLRLAEKKKGRPSEQLRKGKLPRLSEIHFPVGGHRFRPALEDVLVLLEREFAIDVEPDWKKVVEEEIREWRLLQLRSAVRDAHETAAETLRELGYTVEQPSDLSRQRGDARLYWP
ncbi:MULTISPECIES: hypothetical protein [unclassified Streptomyces]|uniref:hypothetical protein n=1 Tax=unclassified Streptomyces TaxID=2593676 RepID=UPI00341872E2